MSLSYWLNRQPALQPVDAKRKPPPPRVTVDGVVLSKGVYVWRSTYGFVTRCKVTSDTLRHWSRFDGCTYSTEELALLAAIAHNEKELAAAKRVASRTTKALARLRARLASRSEM